MLPTLNRGLLALPALLLVTALLAGCHAPEGTGDTNDTTPTPTGDGDGDGMEPGLHISLEMDGLPDTVMVNESFNVTVHFMVENGPSSSSHMGSHYWTNTTGDNPTTTGARASPHVTNQTTLDGEGTYLITNWAFDAAGTYYVRAHVLTTDQETFWGDELTIEVTEA